MKREDALKLVELTERRDLNERHFLRPDGQIEVIIQHNQNYLSGGKWEKREKYKLSKVAGEIVNKSDHINIRINNNRVKVDKNWLEIEGLYLDNTLLEQPLNLTPIYTDNLVTFKDIFTGIDIEFLVTPHRVKETVYIKKNPLIGKFVSGDKLYIKYKTSAKQQFSNVWAKDQRVNIKVLEKWDKKDYYLGVSRNDLNSSQYPIEIDPTITPIPISDVYIQSATSRYDDLYLNVGNYFYDDGKGSITQFPYRSYLRYSLTSISSTVTAATMYVYCASPSGYVSTIHESALEVDPVTGVISTIWSSANGNTLGTFTPSVAGWYSAPCIAYADLHKGGYCDFGIIGIETMGVYTQTVYFSSSNTQVAQRPYLSITTGIISSSIKTINGLGKTSVKTINGLDMANLKTWNGLY